MANNLASVGAGKLLDHVNAVTAYTPTGPLKLRAYTVAGTSAAAGTEVVGGSYAAQTITMGAQAALSAANTNLIDFPNMPACTVVAIEIWDSAGSPNRLWFGALAVAKVLAAGDILEFAIGSITTGLD
jgi:hypothetical protein